MQSHSVGRTDNQLVFYDIDSGFRFLVVVLSYSTPNIHIISRIISFDISFCGSLIQSKS